MSKSTACTSSVSSLVSELQRRGCAVRRTGSGHLRVTHEGRYVTTLPSTLSDSQRGLRNAVAEARRAGVALPH